MLVAGSGLHTENSTSSKTEANRLISGIAAILAHPRLPLLLAVLGPLLLLPALHAGWQLDDYFHRSRMLGYGDANPIQIFVPYDGVPAHTRAQMEVGTLPWWSSADLHLAFLRYGSTLTMLLDYWLWPDQPLWMHLHSLLWLSAVIVAAALLYRQVLGATWVAGLAALLYAIDDAHAMPVTYLANRNALIATCFGCLSILSYIRARQAEWRDGVWLSALLLAVALSAGEMALATAAYLFAFALMLDHGPLRQRLSRLLPHTLVLALWAAIYRIGGFGSHGSGYYLDPLRSPITFVTSFLERVPLLLMGQWTPIPAGFGLVVVPGSSAAMGLRLFSVAVVVMLAVLFVPLAVRDRVARFWGLGVLLSLLPIAAVGAENRVLFFVGLGSMGLLAQLVQAAWAESPVPNRRAWRLVARVAVVVLLFVHLLVAPAVGLAELRFQERVSAAMQRAIASIPNDAGIAQQDLVLLNPPDHVYVVTAIPVVKELARLPKPRRIRALSTGSALEITRVGPRSLQVKFAPGLFPSIFSRFVRSADDVFRIGERVDLPGFSAEVVSLTPQGDPHEVRYDFAVDLEDPSLLWMRWDDGVYVPWTPPANGASETLPAPRGIFG